jgi:uncharacterized membrane protein HdeD (DUF308 family)
MRKKLVLFSSLLATLPAVFAGPVADTVLKLYTALPIELWNPILAFILVAAIINGALSLTNLGKEGGDQRGFALISGSLGGIFSIFVAGTGFDLISFVMPYLFLILLLFMFSIVSVFITPRDDKRNKMRSQGTALIITGALLWGINGAVTDFTEKLGSFKVMGAGDLDVTSSIFALTPYTTLLAIIFIVWGLAKVVSSFSDDEDNPSMWKGLAGFIGGSGSGSSGGSGSSSGSGKTKKLEIGKIKASSSSIKVGDKVTFEVTKLKGGKAPLTYRWTINQTGAPAAVYTVAKPDHTFTNDGASDTNLTVTDADGNDITAPVFSTTISAADPLTASFTIHTSGPPFAPVPKGSAILPTGENVTLTPESDPKKLGGVGPYTYTWIAYPPNPADAANAPPGPTTPPLGTATTHTNNFVVTGLKTITLQITDNHGTVATEIYTFTVV